MEIMRRMGLNCLIAALAGLLLRPCPAAAVPGPWDPPAANLAGQVADLLGPGQVRLTLRNLSSIPADQIPAIRKLLVQDLRARGITLAGAESANEVRITLSESARQRLWVAEVMEGSESRVAMVELSAAPVEAAKAPGTLLLRKQQVLVASEPVLAVLETSAALLALEPEQVVLYAHAADGWQEQQRATVDTQQVLARDPRGVLALDGNGGFEAWLPGAQCAGSIAAPAPPAEWTIQCRASDDPWPFVQPSAVGGAASIRAFYNASRNYFTGVLAPSIGADLPPFYSLIQLPRPLGAAAVLIGGVDGRVQLVENGVLRPVSGARDWGSEFAVLQSGCGSGAQVIVSASGDASSDSLGAYELSALEVVPASESLMIAGTVTALSTAPDGKSVLAVVRNAANDYEVDRVTAFCN